MAINEPAILQTIDKTVINNLNAGDINRALRNKALTAQSLCLFIANSLN